MDNVVGNEYCLYKNIFLSGYNKSKKRCLDMVLRIVSCQSLFEEKENRNACGILPKGIGSLIMELRRKKVDDEVIYESIVSSRDAVLQEKDISDYEKAVFRKQCLEIYSAVERGLMDCLG